jgi:hypothetical protein
VHIYTHIEWILIAVYGAAQEEEKPKFLPELVQTCSMENLPLMIRGDFKEGAHMKKTTTTDTIIDGLSYLMLL